MRPPPFYRKIDTREKEMEIEDIGERICALRAKLGLKQKDIAAVCGVSRQSVGRWEQGLSVPDRTTLASLCEKLGVPHDFFTAPDMSAALEILKGCVNEPTACPQSSPADPEDFRQKRTGKGAVIALIICASLFVLSAAWFIIVYVAAPKYDVTAYTTIISLSFPEIFAILVSIAALAACIILAYMLIKRKKK